MKDFKVAVCQLKTTEDKKFNIDRVLKMIEEAANNGAELVVLPEIFNSPYDTKCFEKYSEVFPGETSTAMMNISKEKNIYLVAGSIPEYEDEKIYNTSYFYNRDGDVIARHRKVHLFDIDIDGGQYFKESDVLSPGKEFTIVDTDLGRIGLGICYDIRFPEYFRVLSNMGAELIVLPAAFNMTTGPAHWEISVRMRAVDNQVYMVAASPARNMDSSYISYANSMIVNPWGEILANGGTEEKIVYAEIKGEKIMEIRNQLPLIKHRRVDLYDVITKNSEVSNG